MTNFSTDYSVHGTLNPSVEAFRVYMREYCPRGPHEDLELFLILHYVRSDHRYFIMAKPVNKDLIGTAESWKIVDPLYRFNEDECNAWHVYLTAGEGKYLFDDLPKDLAHLKYVTYERKNILRCFPLETLKKKLTGGKNGRGSTILQFNVWPSGVREANGDASLQGRKCGQGQSISASGNGTQNGSHPGRTGCKAISQKPSRLLS